MRSLVVGVVLVFAMLGTAAAENPEVAFKGKIMTSTKRFPQTAKSPSAYTAMIRKQSQSSFSEDKTDHSWTIYFAAFLKTPLNDVEYVIKFYELGKGGQQLLATSENFNDERGQKTIVSKIHLDKKQMGVNKELQMTIENKGVVYASTRFKILGEGEHYTGKVNFSEDEKENE
ncbi:MAG TPA: hypothetical protein VGC41_20670 [Kofleriaceae bacterium]